MTMTRWNPWGELFTLHEQMDQLFNETVGRGGLPERSPVAQLALDIRQSDEAFLIEASVPGYRPEEVEVTLDENVLTIRAEHASTADRSAGEYVRRERRSASLFRQVGLPAEVKADEIGATFENGVLTVTVPRAQKAQPRRIRIEGAQQPTVIDAAVAGPVTEG